VIIRVAQHDIPATFAGSDRESTSQVCVELALINNHGINQVSFCSQSSMHDCIILQIRCDCVFGGGANVLTPLIYVDHCLCRCHFQMFVDSIFSQSWSSCEMAILDLLQECIFGWAEHSFVKVVT
jgi:hypothetical protein